MQRQTFKYRLYPTPTQARLLAQVLDVCRHWYNMYMEDRKVAWELERRSVTKGQQEKTGIQYHRTFPKARLSVRWAIMTMRSGIAWRGQFSKLAYPVNPPG